MGSYFPKKSLKKTSGTGPGRSQHGGWGGGSNHYILYMALLTKCCKLTIVLNQISQRDWQREGIILLLSIYGALYMFYISNLKKQSRLIIWRVKSKTNPSLKQEAYFQMSAIPFKVTKDK